MIRLKNVTKSFLSETVIREFSLSIGEGETAVLIGPSGCGKSTLLKLMLGLVTPESGLIRCFGDVLNDNNVYQVRRRIGYVIQSGGLFPNFNAHENIVLMARQAKWSEKDISSRLDELTEITSFETRHLKQYPVQLSGGQRQRVALMRALMLDPEILLLDEPLGALDPMIRYDLQVDLRKIFRELGKTTVIVTHDLTEAAYFSENIILMRDGTVVQQGSISEMMGKPADPFVTRFIKAQRELNID
jgi:osmoprotectant transport system ATP-binding protein